MVKWAYPRSYLRATCANMRRWREAKQAVRDGDAASAHAFARRGRLQTQRMVLLRRQFAGSAALGLVAELRDALVNELLVEMRCT